MSARTANQLSRIIDVELSWVKAHRHLDIARIEEILSDAFYKIDETGQVLRKQDLLNSYREKERYWEIAESTNHHVELFGYTAVLTGTWRGKGTNDGVPFDYSTEFMTVYIYENGAWKMLTESSK